MKKINKKQIIQIIIAGALLVVIFVLVSHFRAKMDERLQKEAVSYMSKLSSEDREMASLYATLYEKSEEDVAKMKTETKDWVAVNKKLEQEYFCIPEQKKYELTRKGYSLSDLYEAETLATQTGRKAMELVVEKGVLGEKKWSDVVKKDEMQSVEEQLGLTQAQKDALEKAKYSNEERIEIALLCINRKQTYEEVMKELKSGKSIEALKEETGHETKEK